MTKGFLTKNFLTVINDSTVLAQVFVVILFFENYLILFQKTSLFDLKIDFGSIQLAPFIWFFIFIAGFKLFWWMFHTILTQVKIKFDWYNNDIQISSKIHFLAFLLVWLISLYFYNIIKDDQAFSPIDPKEHQYFFNLFLSPAILILFLGSSVVLFADIKYEGEE